MVQEIEDLTLPQNGGEKNVNSIPPSTITADLSNRDDSRSAEEELAAKEVEDRRTHVTNPATTSSPTVSLDDLKAILTTVTKDLANSVTETNRRLDELARGIQRQPNSEVTPPRSILPRTLACSFDLTDAQSNRFAAMPRSSHHSDVQNEQPHIHPQAPGTYAPGSSTLDHGGHLEDIYAKLREIGSQVHKVVSSAPEIDLMIEETQTTPFTDRVTRTQIPQVKLKLPTYEGGSDPKYFMTAFMTTIAKAHFCDEQRNIGCCQLFVEGLTGNALTWFSRLEANSIDNFTQLSTAFLKQYRVFIQSGASSSDLWSMTQESDETLNAYLGRFKEILSKATITDEAAMAALRKGLLQGSQGHSTEEWKHLLNILLGKYKSGEVEEIYHPKGGKSKRKGGYKQTQGELEDEDQHLPENYRLDQNRKKEVRVPENKLPEPPKKLQGQQPERAPNQPRGRISMIIGGLSDGEDSVRALKKRARQVCSVRAMPEDEQLSQDPITFTSPEAHRIQHPHNDALVVEVVMEDFDVERLLIDTRSSVNLMFLKTLTKMGISEKKIKPKIRPLARYDGEAKMSFGENKLLHARNSINLPSVYEILDSNRNIHLDEECAAVLERTALDLIKAPSCQIIQVNIDESDPSRTVGIGSELEGEMKEGLIGFLKSRSSTFAWFTKDMTGIAPEVTCHRLNTDPNFKPVRQKRRRLGPDRTKAVQDEVERLLKASLIMEVQYPEWLANPVVIKKKDGKWRVCVVYTDLNKACPKDSYPLPHRDRLVEATDRNQLLSFMDAFIIDRGIYCYRVMLFGLKNAGATYQRLVKEMFSELLRVTMEVYIDNMLVKSLQAGDHIQHLNACIDIMDKYQMKLNPTKCTFGVTSSEFLGYIVIERGTEANPKQINVILELLSPQNKREVQHLTGRIAGLNRFIARSADKCLPFYNLLRGNKDSHWDEKCEIAFQELKEYLTSGAILAKPEEGETLYLYVSAPLRTVLHSPNQFGRIAKWAIELSEYDVEYRSMPSLKSQVLADFMTELSPDVIDNVPEESWILYADGSSSLQGSELGILLQSPARDVLE
ncbi:Retrotransposon gag domain [Arabidopsis suecica]|uniref:Retrotransposon gag domain n=1 Tax=Arabidopsis suecica TaxID=45249 RepID=A0A8T1ZTY7_ARASU|nr:Retrotransposon gag domain [Arabidopsis suecica]